MPLFQYKAYDGAGDLTSGEIEAPSSDAVFDMVLQQGLTAFAVSVVTSQSQLPWWQREVLTGKDVSRAELSAFTRELATLAEADLPLDELLRLMIDQAPNAKVRNLVQGLYDRVMDGSSLSDALAAREDVFANYYISIVLAGENSGSLKVVFLDLAEFLERNLENRSKIYSALVYPMILILFAIIALALIVNLLIPNIVPLFEDSGAEMPDSVTVIMALRSAVIDYWPAAIVLAVAGIAGIVQARRSESVRFGFDQLMLRLPVIRGVVMKGNAARFARTLATLLRSGVSLIPALQIARSVVRNRSIEAALGPVIESVREGESLSAPLKAAGVFPVLAERLITVGEEVGRLDRMLFHVAQIYEKEVQRQIDRFMTLLTPTLTILIGIGVGGLIMSVMTAILSVNELAF